MVIMQMSSFAYPELGNTWSLSHQSDGKFTIFKRREIGGGWVKRADLRKIRTKDRNFHVRVFGKIGLNIGEGGASSL